MREVLAVFLKLGLIGFGGPVAHLALMEEEVVERRKWLTREHFLDLVGLTNLLKRTGFVSAELGLRFPHFWGFRPVSDEA